MFLLFFYIPVPCNIACELKNKQLSDNISKYISMVKLVIQIVMTDVQY